VYPVIEPSNAPPAPPQPGPRFAGHAGTYVNKGGLLREEEAETSLSTQTPPRASLEVRPARFFVRRLFSLAASSVGTRVPEGVRLHQLFSTLNQHGPQYAILDVTPKDVHFKQEPEGPAESFAEGGGCPLMSFRRGSVFGPLYSCSGRRGSA